MSAPFANLPRWVMPAVIVGAVILFAVVAAVMLLDDPTSAESLCDRVAGLEISDQDAGFALFAQADTAGNSQFHLDEPDDLREAASHLGLTVSRGNVTIAESEQADVLAEHCGGG